MSLKQSPGRLAIVVAVESEIVRIRRRLTLQKKVVSPVGTLWQGRLQRLEVVLLRCGMGPQRAAAGVDWLSRNYQLSGILSVGFAGGLQPQLATGDAMLVTHIRGVEPESASAALELIAPADWVQAAARAADGVGLVRHKGLLLSSAVVVSSAAHKQQLGREFQALAVDMESYGVGCVAAARHLPFTSLRTIFDTSDEDLDLPAECFTTADGRLHLGRLWRYIARHPQSLAQFPALWGKARLAGRHLDTWLDQFLSFLSHAPK